MLEVDMSETWLGQFSGDDMSPMEKALAFSARDDALASVQEKRQEAEREAARQDRLEALDWANRRGGNPLGEMQRARMAITAYDDEVRDLSAKLEKAQAKLTRAQGNLEYWSKRTQEVTAAVSRSVQPDDLLAPAKEALAKHFEFVQVSRSMLAAAEAGRPVRSPKEVSRGASGHGEVNGAGTPVRSLAGTTGVVLPPEDLKNLPKGMSSRGGCPPCSSCHYVVCRCSQDPDGGARRSEPRSEPLGRLVSRVTPGAFVGVS
jgi:hypothetical protein